MTAVGTRETSQVSPVLGAPHPLRRGRHARVLRILTPASSRVTQTPGLGQLVCSAVHTRKTPGCRGLCRVTSSSRVPRAPGRLFITAVSHWFTAASSWVTCLSVPLCSQGIVRAIRDYQGPLKEHEVTVFVRRGGPNYQEGLRVMGEVGKMGAVALPPTPSVVGCFLGVLPWSSSALSGCEACPCSHFCPRTWTGPKLPSGRESTFVSQVLAEHPPRAQHGGCSHTPGTRWPASQALMRLRTLTAMSGQAECLRKGQGRRRGGVGAGGGRAVFCGVTGECSTGKVALGRGPGGEEGAAQW